jgi:undecaprenyl-diphosphatase
MDSSIWNRAWGGAQSVYERLNLTLAGIAALVVGLATLGTTAVIFGGVTEDVTRHNGLSTTDVLHLHWFIAHRTDALVSASRVVSEIGSPAVLGISVVAAAVWLWMRGLRLGLALAPGFAFVVAAASATLMKTIVGRHRPPISLHLVTENNASFPSGHATDATAFFVTFALITAIFVLRKPLTKAFVVIASGLVAAMIGISRLVLGVHWPTDVLAGWALGLSAALVVTIMAALVASADRTGNAPQRAPVAIALHLFDRRRDDGTRLQAA